MKHTSQTSHNSRVLDWTFPLPRTHTGMLIGNGVQGLMIWGEETLNVTVGRSGFWDHRGASDLLENTTYSELRAALERGDESAVRAMYAKDSSSTKSPDRPIQLGCGRIELGLPQGATPRNGRLDLSRAIATVECVASDGDSVGVKVQRSIRRQVAWIEIDADHAGSREVAVKTIPTWDYVGERLSAWGYDPPERWVDEEGGGFCQATPVEPRTHVPMCAQMQLLFDEAGYFKYPSQSD